MELDEFRSSLDTWLDRHDETLRATHGAGATLDASHAPAETPIAWERQRSPEGRNILFGDGRVELVPNYRAEQMIIRAMPAN